MEKKNKSINKKNILKDEDEMLEEYDIENLNPRPNPYYQILKKQIRDGNGSGCDPDRAGNCAGCHFQIGNHTVY